MNARTIDIESIYAANAAGPAAEGPLVTSRSSHHDGYNGNNGTNGNNGDDLRCFVAESHVEPVRIFQNTNPVASFRSHTSVGDKVNKFQTCDDPDDAITSPPSRELLDTEEMMKNQEYQKQKHACYTHDNNETPLSKCQNFYQCLHKEGDVSLIPHPLGSDKVSAPTTESFSGQQQTRTVTHQGLSESPGALAIYRLDMNGSREASGSSSFSATGSDLVENGAVEQDESRQANNRALTSAPNIINGSTIQDEINTIEAYPVLDEAWNEKSAPMCRGWRKWHRRPWALGCVVGSFFFVGGVIGLVVYLTGKPTATKPPLPSPSPEEIACGFLGLKLVDCRKAKGFDSDEGGNVINGSTIPSEIGVLTQLTYLALEARELKGFIPETLSSLTNLNTLNLFNNSLEGIIPSSISTLTELTFLGLAMNGLEGSIPSWIGTSLRKLTLLSLMSNRLKGTIPTSISGLTDLTALLLSQNSLTSSIPTAISDLSRLEHLSIHNNHVTGSIPEWISNLTALTTFIVADNDLTGSIPGEISSLIHLTDLTVSHNYLTGSIPWSIGNLTVLNWLSLSRNSFTGSIPASFADLAKLTTLWLHDVGELQGTIPDSLCSHFPAQFYVDCDSVECSCCMSGIDTSLQCNT